MTGVYESVKTSVKGVLSFCEAAGSTVFTLSSCSGKGLAVRQFGWHGLMQ